MKCWPCEKPITSSTNIEGICDDCYVDPVNNSCTRCGKFLSGIPYKYICGDCIRESLEQENENLRY